MQVVSAATPVTYRQDVFDVRLTVRLATRTSELLAAQQLRYRVFCEEMGAEHNRHDGRDVDEFDDLCDHLIVIDEKLGKVVGTCRILAPWGSSASKRLCCEREFRIDSLKPIAHTVHEVGRACIHPAYRRSVALARLWSGLSAYGREHHVRYLVTCASVPLEGGSLNMAALRRDLMAYHLAPEDYRVEPIHGLHSLGDPGGARPVLPPLLKNYLRLGAWVCGEPAWCPDTDCAVFFALLRVEGTMAQQAQQFRGTRFTQ